MRISDRAVQKARLYQKRRMRETQSQEQAGVQLMANHRRHLRIRWKTSSSLSHLWKQMKTYNTGSRERWICMISLQAILYLEAALQFQDSVVRGVSLADHGCAD